MLKTEAVGRGFQHLPRDLANVNAWKTMFDPYIDKRWDESLRSCLFHLREREREREKEREREQQVTLPMF